MEEKGKKFLFFDTETTGLPKNWGAPLENLDNWPRLVQLAWIICDENGDTLLSEQYIIKPEGFEIPEESSRVHGITTEQALKEGYGIEPILKLFAANIAASDILVAHNINFDEKVMGAEYLRKEIQSELFEKPRVCTMQSSINFCAIPGPYGYKYPKLSELHIMLFGTDFEDAHDAFVDTSACARCFFGLVKKGIITIQ